MRELLAKVSEAFLAFIDESFSKDSQNLDDEPTYSLLLWYGLHHT